MSTLPTDLRNQLDRTIVVARDAAEAGARAALEALAVHQHEPYSHMKPAQRAVRNHLRARARQLGDRQIASGRLAIDHLTGECAYEHWHRMLFARFLAENGLLIEPQEKMAISLAEAEELAKEDGVDVWVFASRCAQRMLPQIFRPDDPLLQVSFATEHMLKLDKLLASLPQAVFTASDALGWVYQFWQSKKKDEVNRSEVKIGADQIAAVTQLFTEPYMVEFLLHNTLGAWWAGKVAAASSRWPSCTSEADCRRLCALPGLEWNYLRFIKVEAASSRLNRATRQDAASTVGFYRKDEPIANLSGNLPHWRQGAVTYFVTFRTVDSLPQDKLKQWQSEREQWLVQHPEPHDEDAKREYYERFPERLEHWLDQGYGACRLKAPALRKIVEDALRHFDGERYDLDEFVVSANHVHALVTPQHGHELSDILHSWKSFTANQINRHIAQSGAFWQKESFDHIVRNPAQLERIRGYVREHEDKDKRQDAASTCRPAAGTFDGWPKTAAELKVLDPCTGSGHFLVAGLHHLVPIRMAEEGLSAREAVDAVLRDNLHGLEIDERCCQIAAFALAFAAWRYPDAGGYRPLPDLHIACTGIGPQSTQEQWVKLPEESGMPTRPDQRERVKNGLLNLHRLFSQAPTLGSLINPTKLPSDVFAAGYETIQPYLAAVLSAEKADDETRERAIAAAGMVKAADLLADDYTLVITNVPYLGRRKQCDVLRHYCDQAYPAAKPDLATCFAERCLGFCAIGGTTAVVLLQNSLFLTTYSDFRRHLLVNSQWNVVARLGPKGFQTPMYDFGIVLLALTRQRPSQVGAFATLALDHAKSPDEKARLIPKQTVTMVSQAGQIRNPDIAIVFDEPRDCELLSEYADSYQGSGLADIVIYRHLFWEIDRCGDDWVVHQSSPDGISPFSGLHFVTRWENGQGTLAGLPEATIRGRQAWGKQGIACAWLGRLPTGLYLGTLYDNSAAAIVPKNPEHLAAVWCFCSSPEFSIEVRKINQKTQVANATLVKVPFDLAHWQKIAAEKYPNGLPEPESDDPAQWLFHGYPGGKVEAASSRLNQDTRQDAASTLQVAVARLLGYRWPAELDDKMRLSKRARALVKRCDELAKLAADNGIVCIPSVRGEEPAAERLQALLEACGSGILPLIQSAAGSRSHLDLDDWLRNGFFEEHCKLFHDRPFVWHIWDGRKRDGFHALVNYHRLCGSGFQPLSQNTRQDAASTGRKLLESLTYSYLGEWITRQKDGVKRGEGGAEDRLAAAVELQERLVTILEGEPPFDIFVRWKPLREQPIGWEPDINDGVRVNIRPFLASDMPNGRTGAGVLRWKPNIKWTKDRGKEPDRPKAEYPWFWSWDEKTVDFAGGKTFDGNRWNDCHYTNKPKHAARDAGKGKP